MRKFIAVLILIILGILLFVTFSNKTSQDRFDKSLLSNADRLLVNLQEDYADTINKLSDLQKAPEQVLELNNVIMQKLYSGDVDDEEIELLVKFQRMLYDDELIANNPFETHLEKIKEEIKEYNDNGTRIIGYDTQKNDDNNTDDMFFIKVVYHINNVGPKGEIYEEYLLVRDKELWKIKGWQKTEEFIVVGD